MATRAPELTTFMQEPPVIEISNGIVLVHYRPGTCCSDRAMSVRCLERSVDRARRALERYAAGETDVIVDD